MKQTPALTPQLPLPGASVLRDDLLRSITCEQALADPCSPAVSEHSKLEDRGLSSMLL